MKRAKEFDIRQNMQKGIAYYTQDAQGGAQMQILWHREPPLTTPCIWQELQLMWKTKPLYGSVQISKVAAAGLAWQKDIFMSLARRALCMQKNPISRTEALMG